MDPESGDEFLIRVLELQGQVTEEPAVHGPTAVVVLAEARETFRRSPAMEGAEPLVVALSVLSAYEQSRMEHRRARVLLDEAAGIARRFRIMNRLRDVLLARGAVNLELGRFAAARRDVDLAAATTGGISPAVDLNEASLLYNVGRLADAAELCRRALADPEAPRELRVKVGNNLGLIEAQRGRPERALAHLDEALALATPVQAAVVTSSRGWVLAQAGRLAESLREFDAAEKMHREVGLPLGELFLEQLDALVDLRLLPEAQALAEVASTEFRAHGVDLMAGEAQLRAARVALLAGDTAAAAETARAVSAEFRRQHRTGWTARAQTLAVHAAFVTGDASAADLTSIRRAARVLERLGLRSDAVDAHLVAGRLALSRSRRPVALAHFGAAESLASGGSLLVRLRGRLAAASAARARSDDRETLRHSRAGLADLSRHRAALGSMELRALASGHGTELGRIGLRTLLRSGSAVPVLDWMERTRAASLLTVSPPTGPEVRAQVAALSAVQAELEAERRESHREPAALLHRQTALEAEIRRASWANASEHDPGGRTVSIAAARRLLDGRTAVVFGSTGSRSSGARSFAVVVTPRRTTLVPLGPTADAVAESDAVLFALRRLTRPGPAASLHAARNSADHGLRRLHDLLLGPLELDPEAPLVVVPDGATRHVPWSALHPAPVSVAPSLSLWARSAPTSTRGAGGTVLVAGPGLPGAEQEVASLAGLHPGATVLVPPDSTVPAVTAALSGAGLAHLACHGLLRVDNPIFSSLRLSGGDLSLHELDQLGSAPRRVVLAACDSAAGVSYAGDEVLGFVGALMARGSVGLAASVARVGDVEAVELNTALHVELRAGRSLADAVHGARATVDPADPRAFVNWCATTAFGAG